MTAAVAPSAPVSRLVLWRHGRTEWNATGRFQGQLDPPLDAEGRRQAAAAAAHLVAALGLRAEDSVVVSSDLSRAVDTAGALAALLGLSVQVDSRLREHGLGCWEGLTRDQVAERHPDQFADWLAGRPVRGRGGEEAGAVAARAMAAVRNLPSARVAVLVTHGGTSNRLLEALLDLGPQHRRVFGPLGNCCWSELSPDGTRWRLLRHNVSAVPAPSAARAVAPASAPNGGAAPADVPAAVAQDAEAVP